MVGNNELTLDFINLIYEINKKLWCEAGECHLETWCDSACWAMKFLSPIMDYHQKDVTIKQKDFFFIIHCLKHNKLLQNCLNSLFGEFNKFFVKHMIQKIFVNR